MTLVEEIARRRRELGLSYGRVEMLGGPSASFISRIERGLAHPADPNSFYKLDVALSWKYGTARAIADGTAGDDRAAWVEHRPKPTPIPRPHMPSRPARPRAATAAATTSHDNRCVWKLRYDALRAEITFSRPGTRSPAPDTRRKRTEDYWYWAYAAEVADAIVEQASA